MNILQATQNNIILFAQETSNESTKLCEGDLQAIADTLAGLTASQAAMCGYDSSRGYTVQLYNCELGA